VQYTEIEEGYFAFYCVTYCTKIKFRLHIFIAAIFTPCPFKILISFSDNVSQQGAEKDTPRPEHQNQQKPFSLRWQHW